MRNKIMCCGLVLLAACGGLRLERLEPGKVEQAAVRERWTPTAEWENPDGSRTLEFAWYRGQQQTWMLDFDAQGVLRESRQVLRPESVALVRTAMTRAEVRRILGPAASSSRIGADQPETWLYPLDSAGAAGEVVQTIFVEFHPRVDAVRRVNVEAVISN